MNFKRLTRILLFKPPKLISNIYSFFFMPISGIREEYSNNLDRFEFIGEVDNKMKIHFFNGKKKYSSLFREEDIYQSGKYCIVRKGKVGVATDGKRPVIYKKFNGNFEFEFKSEIYCLLRLQDVENVPKILGVDFQKKIIYMSYFVGVSINKVESRHSLSIDDKKIIDEKCRAVIDEIHGKNIILADLDARNIIYHNDSVNFIDFGDSINCTFLPRSYFNKLKTFEISNYQKRVKKKYLKMVG